MYTGMIQSFMKKPPLHGSTAGSIPPLAETCASFNGFKDNEKRGNRIFELLTIVIQRCRGKAPKRFYTVRAAAAFFGVSLRTVTMVYNRLSAEGVLIRVRSSQTIIAARTPRSRFAIRGVVCMPIWLPGFLNFLDLRRLFSQLEEEFSRYQFVLEPIFYKQGEENTPAFVDRVLKFNPDYVLWHCPLKTTLPNILGIVDAGVRLIVITDTLEKFPGRTYRISYEKATQEGIKAWAASGEIDHIVVQQNAAPPTLIQPIFDAGPLPYQFKIFPKEEKDSLDNYLIKLASDRRAGIVFNDDLFLARICMREPKLMLEVFRQLRVMVLHPVMMPLTTLPDLTVDALLMSWKNLASQIAMDLNEGRVSISSTLPAFEAKWHPRVPLEKVVQCYFME